MLSDQFQPQRPSQQRKRLQQRLNRLYWTFTFIASVIAAYMVGYVQGYMA